MSDDYLTERGISELFDSLSKNVLINRPDDVVNYLIQSISRIKVVGLTQFKREIYKIDHQLLFRTDCDESNKPKPKTPPMKDYRVLVILVAPGEAKPIGQNLSHIFVDCAYINLGVKLSEYLNRKESSAIAQLTAAKSLMDNGDYVTPDVILTVLLDEIQRLNKSLIILEGYPKTMKQVKDFENAIGLDKLLKVIAVDSYERNCRENLLGKSYPFNHPQITERRLTYFKSETLPVLLHFQNLGKLVMLHEESDELKVFQSITEHLNHEMPEILKKCKSQVHPIELIPHQVANVRRKIDSGEMLFKYSTIRSLETTPELNVQYPIERRFNLATTPLVIIQGPTRCGKTLVARELCKRLEGWYHFDFNLYRVFVNDSSVRDAIYKKNACHVYNMLESISSYAVGIIIENFPMDQFELNQFLRTVGNIDLQIFIDTNFSNLVKRISLRQTGTKSSDSGEFDDKLLNPVDKLPNNDLSDAIYHFTTTVKDSFNAFTRDTLPVVRYFAGLGISFDIDGNFSIEEMANQIYSVIRAIFYN